MFGIENSKDRLQLLKSNFEKFRIDSLNISLAEQTCSDAWHLIDWVYSEQNEKDSTLTKTSFRTKVYNDCPEIKILHDLVNSVKHKKLTNPKVRIIETKRHQGDFSNDFSNDYDVSSLQILFENQEKIDLDELVQIVISYWEQIINE